MRAATFATIGFSWNIILKTLWWIWFKAYSGNLMLIFSLIMKKDAKLILSSGRSTSIRDSIISNFIHQWNLLWIWQWGGINCFSLNLMVMSIFAFSIQSFLKVLIVQFLRCCSCTNLKLEASLQTHEHYPIHAKLFVY